MKRLKPCDGFGSSCVWKAENWFKRLSKGENQTPNPTLWKAAWPRKPLHLWFVLSLPSLMQRKGALHDRPLRSVELDPPFAVTDKREKLKWNKKRWKKAVNRMAWVVSRDSREIKKRQSNPVLISWIKSLSLKKKKWLSVSLHYVLILTKEF